MLKLVCQWCHGHRLPVVRAHEAQQQRTRMRALYQLKYAFHDSLSLPFFVSFMPQQVCAKASGHVQDRAVFSAQ